MYENVALAMQVIGKPRHAIETSVPDALDLVGLSGKDRVCRTNCPAVRNSAWPSPAALSIGPDAIIADEPPPHSTCRCERRS